MWPEYFLLSSSLATKLLANGLCLKLRKDAKIVLIPMCSDYQTCTLQRENFQMQLTFCNELVDPRVFGL
eukprot:6412495-Amphidinium_carterae.1